LVPKNSRAHFVKAQVLRLQKQFDAAIAEYAFAIKLDPNYASAYAWMGYTMILAGRAAEGIPLAETAIGLSPRDPSLYYWDFQICHAYNHLGSWEQAITWCRKSAATGSVWIAQLDLIAAYGWLGRVDEAKSAITELHRLMPGYSVQNWATRGPTVSQVPKYTMEYQRIIEGLRKGGLAEL
jgi:adenylate cyclase